MRRGGVVVSMVGTLLLAGALSASAADQFHQLSSRELLSEMKKNRKLAAYVERNGCPDVAKTQFLSDEPPWDVYQVTLDYFGLRKEISFARAVILGDTSVHVEKYERPLSDKDIAALQATARPFCAGGRIAIR